MASQRELDLVLFGATGFTGQLTADYLARHGGALRWGLGGRNLDKLEQVRQGLALIDPACAELPLIQAQVGDAASLRAMAERTQMVASTVGPYVRYGEPLVEACVEAGTDYADITGEPEFVSNLYRRFDDEARRRRLRLVSCCGFDSIPHDLGALFTVRHLPSDVPIRLRGFVLGQGTFSGGTWQSAVEAMGRFFKAPKQGRKKRTSSPPERRVGALEQRVFYEPRLKSWACPLPTIDPVIVLRSARQLDVYGPDFRYGHYLRVKSLPRLLMGGAAVTSIFALAQLGPTRKWLLGRRQSGEGPSAEVRAKSSFSVTFHASAGERQLRTVVRGGDPGYGETSKMLAESALSMTLDGQRLPAVYGVLTPAVAMGDVLLQRLQAAGMVFEVLTEETSQA